jgi:hypothetical protein
LETHFFTQSLTLRRKKGATVEHKMHEACSYGMSMSNLESSATLNNNLYYLKSYEVTPSHQSTQATSCLASSIYTSHRHLNTFHIYFFFLKP